jgi:hypothetical protein
MIYNASPEMITWFEVKAAVFEGITRLSRRILADTEHEHSHPNCVWHLPGISRSRLMILQDCQMAESSQLVSDSGILGCVISDASQRYDSSTGWRS